MALVSVIIKLCYLCRLILVGEDEHENEEGVLYQKGSSSMCSCVSEHVLSRPEP